MADEIIVADTGSTDSIKEIALRHGAKVYNFPWIDNFSATRNFAFSKATTDYLLWLDADDVILPDEREKLLALKQTFDPSVDAVMMCYDTAFDEQGRATFSFFRERLSKRDRNF